MAAGDRHSAGCPRHPLHYVAPGTSRDDSHRPPCRLLRSPLRHHVLAPRALRARPHIGLSADPYAPSVSGSIPAYPTLPTGVTET